MVAAARARASNSGSSDSKQIFIECNVSARLEEFLNCKIQAAFNLAQDFYFIICTKVKNSIL
jgi:hypothetical protein